MKIIAFHIALFFATASVLAQSPIDRKIIVEGGKYHYVKIHPWNQMGTLHVLDGSDLMDSGKAYALPAGRGYFEPINPLAWDIADSDFYAVSFIDNPLNDRNEAIKRFALSGLRLWSEGVRAEDLIQVSVDYHMLASNEPYQFMLKQSNVLEGFFFDGISWEGNYWMVVANQGQLSIWKYDSETWQHSEIVFSETKGYFSLVVSGKKLRMISNNGTLYDVSLEGITAVKNPGGLTLLNNGVIVDNRDSGELFYVSNSAFDVNSTIEQIISKNGKPIF